jgi:hypothetical protein
MLPIVRRVVQGTLEVDGEKDGPLKVDAEISGGESRELARLERVRLPNALGSDGQDGEDGERGEFRVGFASCSAVSDDEQGQ